MCRKFLQFFYQPGSCSVRKDSSFGFNHCKKKKKESNKTKPLKYISQKAILFFLVKAWQIKGYFVIPEKYLR